MAIHGPAGFGKTTLAAQWREVLVDEGVTVAWLTIDSDDNNVVLFLAHLIEAVRSVGVPCLAEEIMELQLLDRYNDAQLLLDGATGDSAAKEGSILPDLLFAQLKQHYNLGRLHEADETASALIELGQVTGTTVHVIEGVLMRTTVALLRGEPERPHNDCGPRCASQTTTRFAIPACHSCRDG